LNHGHQKGKWGYPAAQHGVPTLSSKRLASSPRPRNKRQTMLHCTPKQPSVS